MITNSSVSQRFPGLTLKAWAQVTSAGVVVKSYNVATSAVGSAGNYTVVFSTPVATAGYFCVYSFSSGGINGGFSASVSAKTINGFTGQTYNLSGTAVSVDHYFEVYE